MLNKLVKECISKHRGGRDFFNALDSGICKELLTGDLMDNLEALIPDWFVGIVVVSGKFGRAFINRAQNKKFMTIIVNGGLGRGKSIDDLSYIAPLADKFNKSAIFIDDSFYSGNTRNVIAEELYKQGFNLVHTIVVYDGGYRKDEDVSSLYRYWDMIKDK